MGRLRKKDVEVGMKLELKKNIQYDNGFGKQLKLKVAVQIDEWDIFQNAPEDDPGRQSPFRFKHHLDWIEPDDLHTLSEEWKVLLIGPYTTIWVESETGPHRVSLPTIDCLNSIFKKKKEKEVQGGMWRRVSMGR